MMQHEIYAAQSCPQPKDATRLLHSLGSAPHRRRRGGISAHGGRGIERHTGPRPDKCRGRVTGAKARPAKRKRSSTELAGGARGASHKLRHISALGRSGQWSATLSAGLRDVSQARRQDWRGNGKRRASAPSGVRGNAHELPPCRGRRRPHEGCVGERWGYLFVLFRSISSAHASFTTQIVLFLVLSLKIAFVNIYIFQCIEIYITLPP